MFGTTMPVYDIKNTKSYLFISPSLPDRRPLSISSLFTLQPIHPHQHTDYCQPIHSTQHIARTEELLASADKDPFFLQVQGESEIP